MFMVWIGACYYFLNKGWLINSYAVSLKVSEELARALVHQDKAAGVEVCRLIGEAGKCR